MDELEMRRRRAIYRAQHRGTKELDILMTRYADAKVSAMGDDELALFERFLLVPEPQLFDWLMKGTSVDEPEFQSLVGDVRRLNGF
ncbi:MAG: succinate dehydrogenase assembly factor 2 [Alphaproteobacteria bacterium]|nr:succinate dehydrogenase assembly factor 2 [Alphaproteobacteria bacterium]